MTTSNVQPYQAVLLSHANTPQSSLYLMVPPVVRSRLPVLSSIRHVARSSISRRSGSRQSESQPTEAGSHLLQSTISLPTSTSTSTPTLAGDQHANDLSLQLNSHFPPNAQRGTNVNWEVATAGVRLWIYARSQAQHNPDSAASRSMHIDSIRYMHMALPNNLTPSEIESLRASISPELFIQLNETQPQQKTRNNHLRQGIAQLVCWMIAAILFFIPLLMTILNRTLQYERDHQLSERILATSMDLASAVGQRGPDLQSAVTRFRAGPVGSALVSTGSWVADGVIGGLNDGIVRSVAGNQGKPVV